MLKKNLITLIAFVLIPVNLSGETQTRRRTFFIGPYYGSADFLTGTSSVNQITGKDIGIAFGLSD
ncbi:MAG: hypothetical protein ABIM42_04630 [candidate division WOR-3 bacterium]